MSIKIGVITLFPEIFPGPLGVSILGKGLEKKKWELEVIDLRKFKQKCNIDDTPFGGGPGMVIRPDVLGPCIESVAHKYKRKLYMSPRGAPIVQSTIRSLTTEDSILFICGRFEGIDQRIIEYYNLEEICVGEIILCGGEIPAMSIIEATVRFFCIGNGESLLNESFSIPNIVEHDHYTHPLVWKEMTPPPVLISGHHKKINEFRKQNSDMRTQIRNDLKSSEK